MDLKDLLANGNNPILINTVNANIDNPTFPKILRTNEGFEIMVLLLYRTNQSQLLYQTY